MRKALLTAMLTLELVSTSTAETLDETFRRCGEYEMASFIVPCVLAAERDAGRELEVAYRRALRTAGKYADTLRESQRAWLRYQERGCRHHEGRALVDGPGVASLAYARCMLRTTLTRLEELRGLTEE